MPEHLLTFAIWGVISLLVIVTIDRIKPLRTTIDHHTEPPTPPVAAEAGLGGDPGGSRARELVTA